VDLVPQREVFCPTSGRRRGRASFTVTGGVDFEYGGSRKGKDEKVKLLPYKGWSCLTSGFMGEPRGCARDAAGRQRREEKVER